MGHAGGNPTMHRDSSSSIPTNTTASTGTISSSSISTTTTTTAANFEIRNKQEPYTLFLETLKNGVTTNATPKQPLEKTRSLKYIFGFSTGHTGSTSIHNFLAQNCDTMGTFYFEDHVALELKHTQYNNHSSSPCEYTKTTLLPYLEKKRTKYFSNKVYFDLGHVHNLPPTLECLAFLLQEQVAFIRIRRNRYDIAKSFISSKHVTPCRYYYNDKTSHKQKQKYRRNPAISYCPFSNEEKISPVALPLPHYDNTNNQLLWDNNFTKYQRFLWLIDEIEYRYYLFQTFFSSPANKHGKDSDTTNSSNHSNTGVTFLEITWSDSEELNQATQQIINHPLLMYGCHSTNQTSLKKQKKHTGYNRKPRNCTHEITLDLQYRKMMKFTPLQKYVLFQKHTQRLDTLHCMESRQELLQSIQQWSENQEIETGVAFEHSWAFPE